MKIAIWSTQLAMAAVSIAFAWSMPTLVRAAPTLGSWIFSLPGLVYTAGIFIGRIPRARCRREIALQTAPT